MSDDVARLGPECGRYAEELAELALGISTGRQRAQVLAHLEACPRCHAEMEQLSLAADSLLEVVPGVEPPLGFEVRLMERLWAGRMARQPVRRQWFVRRSSLALACLLALVAVGAGVGTGWLVRGGHQPPAGRFRVRHRARRTCRGGVARQCRPQHRQGDGVLGRDRLAVHEPRRRVMVRQSDLSGAPGRGEDGAARHLLARRRLRSLGSHARAGDWACPVRFGVE